MKRTVGVEVARRRWSMHRSRELISIVVLSMLACFATGAAPGGPANVVWAERMVAEVQPSNNLYGSHPTVVRWAGDGQAARNRSVCSSFQTHVFKQAYGLHEADVVRWFGLANPQAIDYYDAIEAHRGFSAVPHVNDLQAGDIVAVSYGPGHKPTGHVMMIDGAAVRHHSTAPLEAGLDQYEVAVIDSSHSGHGALDTRFAGGRHTTGVGRGTLRLYVDADGAVAGYAWSTKRVSQFYPVANRHVALGRYSGVPSEAAQKRPSTENTDDVFDDQQ
jgi:hypothetical protein